jgi:hypothetical protein
MLLVRGFALLLLFAFAALAFSTAIPDRQTGKFARRAAMLSPGAQTLAAYDGNGGRGVEMPLGQN